MTKVIRFALPAIAATSTRKMTDEGKLFVDEDDALQSGERRQPARNFLLKRAFRKAAEVPSIPSACSIPSIPVKSVSKRK